jgi:hypothetical protein
MKKLFLFVPTFISLLHTVGNAEDIPHAEKDVQKNVFTPESILPAGADSTISKNPYTGEEGPARKGTVAATLNNIAVLNELLKKNDENPQINQLVEAVNSLIPSLRVIGIFNLFNPDEWLRNDVDQPGRALVCVLYLQQYPKEITPYIKLRLQEIQKKSNNKKLVAEITKALSQ